MFAVLRFQKLKSHKEIRAMFIHWRRDKNTPNADAGRKVEYLLGSCTKDDVTWKLPSKFRSNAVLAMEGVLSASPRYFRPDDPSKAGSFDPARTAEWVERSLTWLKSEFGDRLVSAILHLDEATPHIHIAVVPLKEGRLCARDMFNPRELERMQTEYAQALAPLGIQRGRKGSTAKHSEVAQYYERVRKAGEPLAVSARELIEMQVFGRTPPALAELQAKALDGERAREEVVHLRDEAARAGRIAAEAKEERQALQNRLRAVPLAEVLQQLGYRRTSKDGADWIGPVGRITIKTGANGRHETFRVHDLDTGGHGSIDLVKMTEGIDFARAVAWLATCRTRDEAIATAAACAEVEARDALDVATGGAEIVSFSRTATDLAAVADSLVTERHLPKPLIQALVDSELIFAARSGSNISPVFPLRPGDKTGKQVASIGVRIEGNWPAEGHWGLRGQHGVWSFTYPGPCPGGREVVVLGQSPTSVMSTCALASKRQGLVPPLEQEDIGRIVYVAAEGATKDEARGVLRAAARRGSEVITAFDPDDWGRHLSRLVRDEAQITPTARITKVSELVTLAGDHLSGFWSLWLMLLAEGAQVLKERIDDARTTGKRERRLGSSEIGPRGSGNGIGS